jgi:hypothetical protein
MYSADEIYDTAELENIPTRPDNKPDETDEDLEPNHNDEDLEPTDDFGGSFPLSVEYDDDQLEPTYIDHDHDF